jgi:SecD/SecF fusion protein
MAARSWKLGLILSLGVGVLLGLGFLVYLFRHFVRPDIRSAGGTILIYEIDPDLSPNAFSPQDLASAIRRRIDPFDSAGIKVQPLEDTRIEISIPRATSNHSQEVQQVKDLLSLMGKLEFRILANMRDDRLAIEAAQRYFQNKQNSPQIKAELESLARKGKPPPPPDGKFTVHLRDYDGKYSYKWVELGRQYRQSLNLYNPIDREDPSPLWQEAAQARAKDEALLILGINLLYSRNVANPSRLPAKDRDKTFEYFLLTRNPEDRSKEVTGDFLASAHEMLDQSKQFSVGFHFNREGGNRFRHLTSINVPEKEGEDAPEFKRQLAIILDDQIVSAPTLNGVISTDAVIEGNFTAQEVERLANILRSGALPATLKPQPVSEISVESQK